MRPILILCCGMIAISINNLLFKLLSGDYSLHQLVFIRTVGALAILTPLFILHAGIGVLRTNRIGMHLIRSALLVAANLIFFSSLANLPLAETVAIVFLAPVLLTFFAFLFLKERIDWVRWVCITYGFTGTVLVVQPFSLSFKPVILMPLCAAFFYAAFTAMTRYMSKTEPTERLAFYSLSGFLLTFGIIGIFMYKGIAGGDGSPILSFLLWPWKIPAYGDLPLLGLIAVSSAIIALCLSAAYRTGEASMLAPFEYTALLFTVLWEVLFFGHWPNGFALLGMTVIVSAGMLLADNEIQKNRNRKHRDDAKTG